MADFRPFTGWRYRAQNIRFEDVIAPPYDIISSDEQKALYERSPYNCIRLILNKETENDHAGDNRYVRARDFFNTWREEQVLIREKKPAYYLYRQVFKDPETGALRHRCAVFGKIKLEPFENRIVIPHEKTLSKPKEDRRKLLEATETNFSPIFGLFEDPEGKAAAIYQKVMQNTGPIFDLSDEHGVQHALWVMTDETEVLKHLFSEKKIYIADGHHRYQTALDYSLKKRAEAGHSRELGADFCMMALVEFHDPGLALFPTHRLLTSLQKAAKIQADSAAPERLLEPLKPFFDIQASDVRQAMENLKKIPNHQTALVLAFPKQAHLLILKNLEEAKKQMPRGRAEAWYQLDVSLVSYFILNSLWGLPEAEWESVIRYTHSTPEAVESVQSGACQAAFLLRAPRVEILRDMGQAQELLPQKSTYFYPKLASGVVFHRHVDG